MSIAAIWFLLAIMVVALWNLAKWLVRRGAAPPADECPRCKGSGKCREWDGPCSTGKCHSCGGSGHMEGHSATVKATVKGGRPERHAKHVRDCGCLLLSHTCCDPECCDRPAVTDAEVEAAINAYAAVAEHAYDDHALYVALEAAAAARPVLSVTDAEVQAASGALCRMLHRHDTSLGVLACVESERLARAALKAAAARQERS